MIFLVSFDSRSLRIKKLTRWSIVHSNSIVFLDGKLHFAGNYEARHQRRLSTKLGRSSKGTSAARSYVNNFLAAFRGKKMGFPCNHADRNTRQLLLFNLPLFTYESYISPPSFRVAFSCARPLACAGIPVERTERGGSEGRCKMFKQR